MSINFSLFEIGRSALRANKLGIEVAGQNIANVNTPGYSRRSLQLAESNVLSFHRLAVGTGVTVQGIHAFRDSFIESRIQNEKGIAGNLLAQRDALFPVQTVLQGSENGGLQNALTNFFGAFRDLEANPDSIPLRSLTTQKGEILANEFHSTHTRLENLRTSTDGQLRSTVDQINSLAERVADLNEDISSALNVGGDASALIDQRNEFINEVAELSGVRSTTNDDGTITLTIGEGRPLVAGGDVYKLNVTDTPPNGLATIDIDGDPAVFDSGVIKGYQEAISKIEDNITLINGLAEQVVERVNNLHTSGTDLDGNAGINFFENTPPITAQNIAVNQLISDDPRLVVASPLAQPGQAGTVAGEIANLLNDPNTTVGTKTGSFSSIFGSLVTDSGEQVRNAEDGLQTQAAIIAQATAQREAVSGVSLDEEAINLLQYQKAFEAAARFLKVADEMTQTILSLAQ